ncbi:MAG: class I tRNA ligase family protein, partial [Pirellulales bacterium]
VETIAGKVKRELKVVETFPGSELLTRRYLPPFDYYYQRHAAEQANLVEGGQQPVAWRVVAADFVTTDSGSGVVHQAPAFGEVDYDVLKAEQARFVDGEGPKLICAVAPDGKFTHEAPEYQGRWVKDCDRDITRQLRAEGKLYHQEQYLHDYPFCWRAEEDPLIQYPRESWFVKTTEFKDRMLANNQQINWLPEHIQEGRFGNFLESNVDWALSRERFWGTPLPIWKCQATGKMEAIGSYAELLAKPGVTGTEAWEKAKKHDPDLPEDLSVHKPYIDEVTYDSPFAAGATMRRVPEVIDCWFDSGAMPFAQWGYPYQNKEKFAEQFPADFISEAIDQTRGWFYSQLAISTLLFDDAADVDAERPRQSYPHPFRNCIVLGLMLSEWWEPKDKNSKQVFLTEEEALAACGQGNFEHLVGKMSKSKRNYREPREIFDLYGADALRWYFFANQPPWTSIRYSEQAIKDSIPEFLLRLYNVFSFFVIYANIDEFDPSSELMGEAEQLDSSFLETAASYRPVAERRELDQWILSELNRTAKLVCASMDAYDNYAACQRLNAFVDVLSNWYVRRSRPRFWAENKRDADKLDAYWTLYECLVTTAKLIAPFTPFLAESMWQHLAGVFAAGNEVNAALESVHLCDYPTGDDSRIDDKLLARMELGREIASLGLSARMGAKLKVRQPLAKVEVILANEEHRGWLEALEDVVKEELNVKEVEYASDATQYIDYSIVPDFKKLGPKLGKRMPQVKQALAAADGGKLLAEMEADGVVRLEIDGETIELSGEEIEVRLQAKPGWAAAQGKLAVVVLSTEITPELLAEGMAKDFMRLVQDRRKELNLAFT